MYTPQNFKDEVLGKRFDVDAHYGAQCWDGYAYYMQKIGYAFAPCTSTGYVKDIWNNRITNGMLNSCDIITIMQQGDIAVFGNTRETPYSHITIFMRDNGNGTGVFLGQNQGGVNGAFNETTFTYANILGTFRPKCYLNLFPKTDYISESSAVLNEIPSDFRYENATFTCVGSNINIRRAPSLHGQLTGDWYEPGMSFKYDGFVRREGYVWLSYIGKDDTRRWVAGGELNSAGVRVVSYGSFV